MSKEHPESPSGHGPNRVEGARERLEEGADRAVEEFDERAVDLLSWLLDTETRARLYVCLRRQPWSTSQEVAEETGLYPSTVREGLADLADDGTLRRRKRDNEGAGNNPYEYTAVPPSDLIGELVGQFQHEFEALCQLGDDDTNADRVEIEIDRAENPKR